MSDAPLRTALRQTVDGLKELIPPYNGDHTPTGNANLYWMCSYLQCHIDHLPVDKISRWIGYVQGVLAAKGVLDVKAERDRTRPFFHAAYGAMGTTIPETATGPVSPN